MSSIIPSDGARNPARIFNKVVLPHPEGPRTETSSPFWMLRLMFFKASTEPPLGNSKVIETSFIFKPDMNVSINKICKKGVTIYLSRPMYCAII